VIDNALMRTDGFRAEETLLQPHPDWTEPATLPDALQALSALVDQASTLATRAACGQRIDVLDAAAFEHRRAWLAVRLPRLVADDAGLVAHFITAAAEAVAAWQAAYERATRVAVGWHPDEAQPPTHELRWWPGMFGQRDKWQLTSDEGVVVAELIGPHGLGETELRDWTALHLPDLQVTNLLADTWADPTSTDPGPEGFWCPLYHVHTVRPVPFW
jgi:hypothetical protein